MREKERKKRNWNARRRARDVGRASSLFCASPQQVSFMPFFPFSPARLSPSGPLHGACACSRGTPSRRPARTLLCWPLRMPLRHLCHLRRFAQQPAAGSLSIRSGHEWTLEPDAYKPIHSTGRMGTLRFPERHFRASSHQSTRSTQRAENRTSRQPFLLGLRPALHCPCCLCHLLRISLMLCV